jgi:methylmalonyl-CoA/ethylmalonyl-CoA epimerase
MRYDEGPASLSSDTLNAQGDDMAKLRHIGVTVPDLEAAARFYEKTFDMHRVRESDIAIILSDGTVSLAILKFRTDEQAGDERGKDFHGLHHMGFVVEDIGEASKTVEANGGKYHMKLPSRPESMSELKFRDPNGVVFDIVTPEYGKKSWHAS